MPDMDSYEIGRRLRADPRTAHIPILLMSGDVHVRQAVSQIGANGYLEKPFDLEALISTVAAHARASAR
jgi:CheY-like chemotaxis protein